MSSNALTNTTPVLPFVPVPKQTLISYLESLAQLEPLLVEQLVNQDDAVILETREYAKGLEKYGWRIQCACDAAIWTKTAEARRGRGNKDVEQTGILAAVAKKSKQIGVTPTTIYRNAQVFSLLQEARNIHSDVNILDTLEDKGYYLTALSAADPLSALLNFAEKKTTEQRFRVSDAARLLRAEGQTRQASALRAVENIRQESGQLTIRQALLSHLALAKDIIENQIVPSCPDEEFKERIWEDLLMTLDEEHQELFDADATEALMTAWDNGSHREDEMADKTQLPLPEIRRLMDVLAGLGNFFKIQERDITKRSNFTLWHKAGEPFDNAQYLPKG